MNSRYTPQRGPIPYAATALPLTTTLVVPERVDADRSVRVA